MDNLVTTYHVDKSISRAMPILTGEIRGAHPSNNYLMKAYIVLYWALGM